MGTISRVMLIGVVVLAASVAQAEDLVYKPVNPNFGGNPLNGQFLLDSAILQNEYKDPNAPQPLGPASRFESFAQRLDRAILSELSRQIVASIFGEEGLADGVYNTGLSTVVVETTLDATIITLTDNETGEITVIEIPFL